MKRILVVDDSPTIRRMVIASLRSAQELTFDEAGSGLEALERLALAPADLLILDLNMPDLHGLEVLRFLRGHQRYKATPVIILTTRGDAESRDAAMAGGASAYLTKPFTPQTLLVQARALLAQGEQP